MAQTTDQRLYALMRVDREAFKEALRDEVTREQEAAGPFMARAGERFGERLGVCAQLMAGCLQALRTYPDEEIPIERALAAASVQAVLPRLGPMGSEWAASLLAFGYALALADLAAVPSEDERPG